MDDQDQEQLAFMDEVMGTSPAGEASEVVEVVEAAEIEKVETTQQEVGAVSLEVEPPPSIAPVEAASTSVSVAQEPTIEETLRQQILALTAQIQGTQQRYPEAPKPVTEVGVATQGAQTQTQPVTTQSVLAPFLSPEELDEIIDKPELILTAIQRSNQSVLQQAREMVTGEINRQIMVTKAVTEFYDANKDLAPYANFVQFVMQEMESVNQSKTYAEIFESTASECRKRLGLVSKAPSSQTTRTNNGQQRPAFAGSRMNAGRPNTDKFFDENARGML